MYLKINHIIIYNIMDITILVEENEKLKTEITRTSHHYKCCIVSILDYRNCAEFFT